MRERLGPDAPVRGTPSGAQLETIAGKLGESDIADIIDTLRDLSAEKETVPDWDGDTWDDIFRAQTTLSTLLRMTQGEKPQN